MDKNETMSVTVLFGPTWRRWARAIERGKDATVIRLSDEEFAVASGTRTGWGYRVRAPKGIIKACNCQGWGGRQQPCKHAGRVAQVLRPSVTQALVQALEAEKRPERASLAA